MYSWSVQRICCETDKQNGIQTTSYWVFSGDTIIIVLRIFSWMVNSLWVKILQTTAAWKNPIEPIRSGWRRTDLSPYFQALSSTIKTSYSLSITAKFGAANSDPRLCFEGSSTHLTLRANLGKRMWLEKLIRPVGAFNSSASKESWALPRTRKTSPEFSAVKKARETIQSRNAQCGREMTIFCCNKQREMRTRSSIIIG